MITFWRWYQENGALLLQCTVEGDIWSFGCSLAHLKGGNAVISSRIRIFNSSKLFGWLLNTFLFRYPHRKKSQMLKSGERAGHSIWPYSFEETEREHSIGDWGNDQCRPINVHAQNKARSSECSLSLLRETTEWMFPKKRAHSKARKLTQPWHGCY